jgi:hypothetical protein
MSACGGEIDVSGRPALAPLASLMARRTMALAVIGVSLAHVLLIALGLPGWSCPAQAAVGLPCPGCGLGRAVILLLQGHWLAAVEAHAFAPVLALVILLMCAALLLPPRAHRRFVQSVAIFEETTYVSLVALSGLVLYWLWRVVNGLR